jgi:hypothetical protein
MLPLFMFLMMCVCESLVSKDAFDLRGRCMHVSHMHVFGHGHGHGHGHLHTQPVNHLDVGMLS